MQLQHAPLPWTLHVEPAQPRTPTLTGASHYAKEYIAIVGADGPGPDTETSQGDLVIADNAHYYAVPITKENATFIIEACNAYPTLVEVLQEQKTGAEWRRDNEPENWNGADDEALERLEAALKMAGVASA